MINGKKVIMGSLWKDDSERNLINRARHLLSKEGVDRWLWLVGDSSDITFSMLAEIVLDCGKEASVLISDTGIVGEQPAIRLKRISVTFGRMLDVVYSLPYDLFLLHESDLISPSDVAVKYSTFLDEGRDVVAGWITLGDSDTFYDTWGYRQEGRMFSNYRPYHSCYNAVEPFELESVGSCWMARIGDMMGKFPLERSVLDIWPLMRAEGKRIWCMPDVHIIQPVELWTSHQHA